MTNRGGPDEQRRFFASLPFALRMVLKLLGSRAYATYHTKLYSAPALKRAGAANPNLVLMARSKPKSRHTWHPPTTGHANTV
jgi:hypothetical protein